MGTGPAIASMGLEVSASMQAAVIDQRTGGFNVTASRRGRAVLQQDYTVLSRLWTHRESLRSTPAKPSGGFPRSVHWLKLAWAGFSRDVIGNSRDPNGQKLACFILKATGSH